VDTHTRLEQALMRLGERLIDTRSARVLIPALGTGPGHWFGGGNLVEDDGLWLTGRYRVPGDARTGTGEGLRGLEVAIWHAASFDRPFRKVASFSKANLGDVLSIEGTALLRVQDAWELYISSEKRRHYPAHLRRFQKPGTGVWSIDCIRGPSPAHLDPASRTEVLCSPRGADLHIKDPVTYPLPGGGTGMIYCSHPHTWASSNTGLAERPAHGLPFHTVTDALLPRGPVWDVACTRVTERLELPAIGPLQDAPTTVLYLYDGAECLRPLAANRTAVERPRGHSCEELGGLAYGPKEGTAPPIRLSVEAPHFVSPHASGSCRYASATFLQDGSLVATWQQACADGSQPLMGNRLAANEVAQTLSSG
jgi:hypothetical protein